jgi:hypothetical protein
MVGAPRHAAPNVGLQVEQIVGTSRWSLREPNDLDAQVA